MILTVVKIPLKECNDFLARNMLRSSSRFAALDEINSQPYFATSNMARGIIIIIIFKRVCRLLCMWNYTFLILQ